MSDRIVLSPPPHSYQKTLKVGVTVGNKLGAISPDVGHFHQHCPLLLLQFAVGDFSFEPMATEIKILSHCQLHQDYIRSLILLLLSQNGHILL